MCSFTHCNCIPEIKREYCTYLCKREKYWNNTLHDLSGDRAQQMLPVSIHFFQWVGLVITLPDPTRIISTDVINRNAFVNNNWPSLPTCLQMNITGIHLRTIMHENACRWSFPCVSKQLWGAFSYSNWRSYTKQKSVTKDTLNLQNGLSFTTPFTRADLSSPSNVLYSQALSHKALPA